MIKYKINTQLNIVIIFLVLFGVSLLQGCDRKIKPNKEQRIPIEKLIIHPEEYDNEYVRTMGIFYYRPLLGPDLYMNEVYAKMALAQGAIFLDLNEKQLKEAKKLNYQGKYIYVEGTFTIRKYTPYMDPLVKISDIKDIFLYTGINEQSNIGENL